MFIVSDRFELAGLEHIIQRHKDDLLKKFGIKQEEIPIFTRNIFRDGIEISSKSKNGGFERRYIYQAEILVVAGVGTNGFIVSIYPDNKGKNNEKEKN